MAFEKGIYDAWLASAELPYDILIPLLHSTTGSENIYDEFQNVRNPLFRKIPESYRKRLAENAVEARLDEWQELMNRNEIHSMTIEEAEYPPCLRDIPDPPGILFLQGNSRCMMNDKKAAMIGSRNPSYAGKRATRKIAEDLSRNGVTIISGLAYGIDAESHFGCLEGGSPTIAVMGCGLDLTYPAQNKELKNQIIKKGGLVLSEYSPGTKPLGRHFPYRNRIISGLSDAVILMEAKIRSGSMTTIEHALKQGKEVYAYPGDPVSAFCDGNRMLLREGARFFTLASEVLEDMDWLDNLPYIMQNSECSAKSVPEDDSMKAVYLALEKGDLGFDELLLATGTSPQELMSILTVMQIKKMIELLPGKRYQLKP